MARWSRSARLNPEASQDLPQLLPARELGAASRSYGVAADGSSSSARISPNFFSL